MFNFKDTEGSTLDDQSKKELSSGKQGLGVSVSVMAKTDVELKEEEKSVYDWCKEGNLQKVKEILSQGCVPVNGLDKEVENDELIFYFKIN